MRLILTSISITLLCTLLHGKPNPCMRVCNELHAIHEMDKLDVYPTQEKADTILLVARKNKCDCLPDALNIKGFKYYSTINLIESKKLLHESEKLLKDANQFDKVYVDNQIFLALNHIMDENYDLAILKLQGAKELSIEKNDFKAIANIDSNLGLCYQQLGRFDEAKKYYLNIIGNKEKYSDLDAYGYALENLANIYKLNELYDEALSYNNQALEFWELKNHLKGQYFNHFHKAKLFEIKSNYREQLNSLQKAKVIGKENEIYIVDLHINKQIGDAYIQLGKKDSMAIVFEEILENHSAIKPEDLSYISSKLSYYYLENNNSAKQNSLVVELLENAKQIQKSNKDHTELLLKSYEVIDDQKEEVNQLNLANVTQKKLINWQYFITGTLGLALILLALYLRLVYNSNAFKRKTIKKIVSQNGELKELNKTLDHKNEELEKFAYVTSHDIQGPLQTINALANSVKTKLSNKDYDGLDQHMDFIDNSSGNLINLTEELLGHARSTQPQTTQTLVNFSHLVGNVVNDLQESIKSSGVKVQYDQDGQSLYTDEIKLRQILQNLLSNSIKFSASQEKPLVSISFEDLQSQYQIKVTDNGIGIDPSDQDKIFEMFTSLNKSYKGTGIGLATVVKLVEVLNGTIEVDSKLDEGATFTLTFSK